MDLKKKMAEKSEMFNALLTEKSEYEKKIVAINEELLRIQGEYRVLQEMMEPETPTEE